ncbi:MAG: hypothetical protein F6K42_08895 [Leptolyngbya sp. SIO1D8]|nr:hypothetical protein [Leptolyngbya sp. SIO1D8]
MKVLKDLSYTAGSTARQVRAKLGFPVNQKLIRFCGIQRSGNHALINWITAQEGRKTCFVNGAFPGNNPWEKNWGISYPNFPYWPQARDVKGALVRKELFIYSYENRQLKEVESDKPLLSQYIGKSQEDCAVLILRDPYNTFASWLQREKPVTAETVALWKSYAYEFLGETNVLSTPKVFISFNAWFLDQNYRQKLAGQLGLTFTDNGLGEVTHHGGGSSFDGRALRGDARKMNVIGRFHRYLDSPEFQAIFAADPELKQLSDKIFGPLEMPSK